MNAHTLFRIPLILAIALGLAAPAGFTALAEAPPNDDIANATLIETLPFSAPFDLYEATANINDPYTDCDSYGPQRTVWFRFTSAQDMTLKASIPDKPWRVTFSIFLVTDGNYQEISCFGYDSMEIRFDALSGLTYYFMINYDYFWEGGGFDGTFELKQILPPPNDNFANAEFITATPYIGVSQDTSAATIEVGEPFPSCSWDNFTPNHTVWYAYTPNVNGAAQGHIDRDYESFLAVYAANGPNFSDLTEIGCWYYSSDFTFEAQEGMTYFLQLGSMWESAGNTALTLDFINPPSNDNFEFALPITLNEPVTVNNSAAKTEFDEPGSGCNWYHDFYRTVWFSYTPTSDGFVSASQSNWYYFVAAYTGNSLASLTEIGCSSSHSSPLPIRVTADQTYYFQVGSRYRSEFGEFTFQLSETPPPSADFWWSPGDPNSFENIEFCDSSSDPVNAGIAAQTWDFGDGAASSDNCAYHQYAADGDYTVFHDITTSDGRNAETSKTVSVRTHDVAITRVTAPLSASARQTRTITVDVKNTRYQENVRLVLYKSVVGGYQEVSYLIQYVPVRAGNRTTRFTFNYTFTPQDAALGKVTFKAVAELLDARDAFPADNEAVSTPPTKVTGKAAVAAEAAPSPQ